MSIGVLINHTITFLTSPLAVAMALIAAGMAVSFLKRGRKIASTGLIAAGLVWLWFMSNGLTYYWLGLGLEREFPPQRVEDLPCADAIVLLGGGMGGNTNTLVYPELYLSADRVAHAARIWKAGKAPVIMASGTNELVATVPFLQELGVPRDAIRVENESGNTEENARFVAKELLGRSARSKESVAPPGVSRRPRVLLVTSAWHMRRAMLMFGRYAEGIEVVPAACDYEAFVSMDDFRFFESLLPNADRLLHNSYMLKEIIGYWGYRLLR